MSSKKGFVFTVDAFVALTLVVLVIFVIVYQLNIPSAFFPQQSQTYNYARDVVSTLSTLTVGEVKQTGQATILLDKKAYYGFNCQNQDGTPCDCLDPNCYGKELYADEKYNLEDDHTVLEQIAKDALTNRVGLATTIAQQLLAAGDNPLVPEQFGAKISVLDKSDGTWKDVIVRDKPFTKIQSSASYVILGYLRSKNPRQSSYDYPSSNIWPESTHYGGSISEPLYLSNKFCTSNEAGFGVVPCENLDYSPRYDSGDLMGPTRIKVSVWT